MSELLDYLQELGGVEYPAEALDVWTAHAVSHSVEFSEGVSVGVKGVREVIERGSEDVRTGREEARHARNEARALSTCHNSPVGVTKAVVKYRKGASVVTAKRERLEEREKRPDTREKIKRGEVVGFSAKSRNRLIRTVSEVRRECLPVFVTLTFPAEYPTIERAKRDLDTFIKRLARKFPEVAGVWKLEPQKRGAPHFHLLVWGAEFIELLQFVPWAWYEIVGSDDPNHLLWHQGELGNKPCVQQIETLGGISWYVNKYMSKEVGIQCSEWGRWWGVFFRDRLPVGEAVNVEVSEEKANEFIRYMRRYARIKSRAYKSLTIICNADFWINKLLC